MTKRYKPTRAEVRATKQMADVNWIEGHHAYQLTNYSWWILMLDEFLRAGMNMADAVRTLGREIAKAKREASHD